MNLDAGRILEDVTGRYAAPFAAILSDLLAHKARGNAVAAGDSRKALERIVTETMGIGEVIGASLMLRSAAIVYARQQMRSGDPQWLFREGGTLAPVTFEESLQDMVARTPVTLKRAAERSAQAIAKLYGEGRVVAFARSAEEAVTDRVRDLIVSAMREGWTEVEAATRIRAEVSEIRTRTEDWTNAYARMAFRTNVNTAVTAGRFRQAQDPDVRAVIPAFRFDAVGDMDTRHNHGAADGRVFSVTNTVWNRIAPPLGYNCRCQVSIVTVPELRRMGRLRPDGSIIEDTLPPDAAPDVGFRHGGRPDLFMIGGAA